MSSVRAYPRFMETRKMRLLYNICSVKITQWINGERGECFVRELFLASKNWLFLTEDIKNPEEKRLICQKVDHKSWGIETIIVLSIQPIFKGNGKADSEIQIFQCW